MGRLSGFKYRQIIRKLKKLGFEFDRRAAGSHEIWFNPKTNRYTTIPNYPGDMPEETLREIFKQAKRAQFDTIAQRSSSKARTTIGMLTFTDPVSAAGGGSVKVNVPRGRADSGDFTLPVSFEHETRPWAALGWVNVSSRDTH